MQQDVQVLGGDEVERRDERQPEAKEDEEDPDAEDLVAQPK